MYIRALLAKQIEGSRNVTGTWSERSVHEREFGTSANETARCCFRRHAKAAMTRTADVQVAALSAVTDRPAKCHVQRTRKRNGELKTM